MREEEKNEQKQEQIAPRLQEGPAGSLAVTLGHMPSAAAGWPASSTWAGFLSPVNHSLVFRFSNCVPEMYMRGTASPLEGRLQFFSLLHVGLPCIILFGIHKRVPLRNNSNTSLKITKYLEITGVQELSGSVFF